MSSLLGVVKGNSCMHLCLLIPFDFQQMDRALDQSMCTKQHHLLCIILDEGWIQS